uniref:Growth-regulating factor n=1 Tax=Ananas comosus var. bracteatus TaxID=296719 RepID=A0A6V7PK40_ANACO|nr:unnamed protein product [Ananas comosus var. bracteatus]
MGLGSLCYDYRNSMEPEPGRCRRTDGKKWRCSRDVVAGQKYCERHMHRGRNRSRKPVEPPPGAAPAPAPLGTGTGTGTGTAGLQLMPAAANSSGASSSSGSSNNVSPHNLGFSPTSVLHSGAACRTGPI